MCGTDTVTEFPTLVVVTALTQWNNMRLHGTCHAVFWDASAAEIQSIREQLGTARIAERE